MLNQGSTGPRPLLDKDMKKTLSLSAIMLMTTSPVFAQDTNTPAKQDIIILDEIVVNATLAPTNWWRSASTITEIDETDLQDLGTTDLVNLLNSTPGISIRRYGTIGGTSFSSMRGLTSKYMSVMKDGVDITDPSSLEVQFSDFGTMSTGGISSISVLKGTQSALYGSSAVAGIISVSSINLETAKPGLTQEIDSGIGSNNTKSINYSFTKKSEKFAVGLALNDYSTDGVSSASKSWENIGTGKKNTEKDGFKSQSVSLHGSLKVTDNLTVGANFFQERNSYDFDEDYYDANTGKMGAVDGTPDEHGTKNAVGARIYALFEAGNWTHRFSATKYETKRTATQPTVTGPDTLTYDDKYKGVREFAQYIGSVKVNENFQLSFGADVERETSDTSTLPNGSTYETTNGLFAEFQILPTNKMSILGNIRLDDHSKFGSFTSYRIAPAYKLGEATVLRAQASSGFRAPSIYELHGVAPSPYGLYVGNENLKPETSRTLEFGIDQYLPNGGLLSLTKYETVLEDVIDTDYAQTPMPKFNMPNDKISIAKGTEVSLKMPLSEATNFGISFMSVISQNIPKPDVGSQVTATIQHTFDENIRVNLQAISASDRGNGFYGARKDYQILNVGADFMINKNISSYVKIENAADLEYELEPGYSSPRRTIFAGIRASF